MVNSCLNKNKLSLKVAGLLLFSASAYAQNIPVGGTPVSAMPVTVPSRYSEYAFNSVSTWTPNMPINNPATVINSSRTVGEVKQSIKYLDGLGRVLQLVEKRSSTSGYDIVSPMIYDAFGRERYKYQSYVQLTGNNTDGKIKRDPFTDQRAFYQNNTINPGVAGESVFYSQTLFESSDLDRVSKTFAQGNSWAKEGGSRPQEVQYQVNVNSDSVVTWTVVNNIPVKSGFFAAGELSKYLTIDESGIITIKFLDKEGRTLLTKMQASPLPASGHDGWLCTYYVYDNQNDLRFIIPPLAVSKIQPGWSVGGMLAELCFQYSYDDRKRLVVRKIPGAAAVELVYDKRDRVVFNRDGNLRLKNQWLVTFYDELDRAVQTALYASSATRESLQIQMNNVVNTTGSTTYTFPGDKDLEIAVKDRNVYEATNSITFLSGFDSGAGEMEAYINPALNGGNANIIVNNPLPGIPATNLTPLTYTFYDKYNFAGAQAPLWGDSAKLNAGTGAYKTAFAITNMTRGLLTGKKVRVVDTDQWLTTTVYYNDDGRQVQSIADNISGGQNISSIQYDFSGKVLSTYQRHKNKRSSTVPELTVLTMNSYDAVGRVLAVKKRFNEDASLERIIATNEYDEQGQLKTKRLGINASGKALERLSYEYNIRGWLKSINNGYVNGSQDTSHFGQTLSYDYGFQTNAYNGNISGIRWKGWNDPLVRAYGYDYDKAKRLTAASYSQQNTTGAAWTMDKMNFSGTYAYDANGNITTMAQYGMDGSSIAQIDRLAYTYQNGGNNLQSVFDASTVTTNLGDFKNGTNTGADYVYDSSGNLAQDLNKGITAITYNHMNLPILVTLSGKGTISYRYDAEGNMLRKTVNDITAAGRTISTDYINGAVYENDTLQFVSHDEGRLRAIFASGQPVKYCYDYFVRDHLNNTRVVLTEQSDLTMYAATMESGAAAKENALFSNLDNTRTTKPPGYPEDNSAGANASVAKLTAVNGGKKIGPSLVLRVMAGDTIAIGARSFYKSVGPLNNSTVENPVEGILTDLIQTFNGSGVAGDVHGLSGNGNNTPFNAGFYNNDYRRLKEKNPDNANPNRPKAYLSYVLFDDQFNLVEENSGVKQVKALPDELQTLTQDKMPVKKSGFLYVYTSNESPQEVYFDNIVVTQASGPVLEETHYYPFGLTMAGISSNALKGSSYPENRVKYNGRELQSKEFGDVSGLEWYDYGARMQDPQTGRWNAIDPKIEKYESISPYAYAYNNPIRFIDVKGQDPGDVVVAFAGGDVKLNGDKGVAPLLIQQVQERYLNKNGGQGASFVSTFWNVDITDGRSLDGATQKAYDYVLANYNKDNGKAVQGGKVVLEGYSFGGILATHLAKRLESVDIAVSLLVTVDAAAGPRTDEIDRTVPGNVEENFNIYQTDPSPVIGSHGGANEKKEGSATKVINLNLSLLKNFIISHDNIDDRALNAVVNRIIENMDQDIYKTKGRVKPLKR